MSITATVTNGAIFLPEELHIPDGTQVVIKTMERRKDAHADSLAGCLLEFAGVADDLPPDLAKNLDRYIHGHSNQQ